MTTRALGHVAEILAARTGHHLDTAHMRLFEYVRDIGLVTAPIGATVVQDDVADALLQAYVPGLTGPGLTSPTGAGLPVSELPASRWRFTPLCGFCPSGRECPNVATVVVRLPGLSLPYAQVPTCEHCLPDWNDDVAATAIPIAELTTRPVTSPVTSTPAGGA